MTEELEATPVETESKNGKKNRQHKAKASKYSKYSAIAKAQNTVATYVGHRVKMGLLNGATDPELGEITAKGRGIIEQLGIADALSDDLKATAPPARKGDRKYNI